jgi:hypothetical protein
MSEDFFFCLGHWSGGSIEGPLIALFPDEKIFYGYFRESYPEGLCCFEVGNECQIYCKFLERALDRHLIGVFPNIKVILEFYIGKNE